MTVLAKERILSLIEIERAAFQKARQAGDREAAWIALEREHILGQAFFWLHIQSHVAMLRFAATQGEIGEALGQFVRLVLAPLGNVTGRLPWGNTGRSNVSAFTPMPYPDDLAEVLSRSDDAPRR